MKEKLMKIMILNIQILNNKLLIRIVITEINI